MKLKCYFFLLCVVLLKLYDAHVFVCISTTYFDNNVVFTQNGLLWHLSKHYHFIGSRGLTRFQSILKPNFSKVQNLTDKLGLLFISPSIALRKIENSHLAS